MTSLATDIDVVVIGGGFAGLACARALVRAGHTCVVLEARHRVGGRSFSVPCATGGAGAMVDLGGQWVGPGQPLALQLIDELHLTPKLVRQTWFDDPPSQSPGAASGSRNTPSSNINTNPTTLSGSNPAPTKASLNSGTVAAMSLADTIDLAALVADVEREAEAAEANAAAWATADKLGDGANTHAAAAAALEAGMAEQDALSVRPIFVTRGETN
jgi:monoamine oxidase